MPIVGVKDTRKQQLIDATMASIAELGLQNTTIISISRRAGMSSGIISHYFGGKQGLIEAALRYLLDHLGKELRERMARTDGSPEQRLQCQFFRVPAHRSGGKDLAQLLGPLHARAGFAAPAADQQRQAVQ